MLIMVGAEVNILNAKKDAPLHLAIKGGLAEVAKDLLLRGADHTAIGSKRNYPLHLAARGGQYEVVQALLHRGTNLYCRDSWFRTPLEVAVFEGNVSTVEFLLAEGADVNFRKFFFDNETTLHFAAEHNKAASIPALIEPGPTSKAEMTMERPRSSSPAEARSKPCTLCCSWEQTPTRETNSDGPAAAVGR